MQFNVSAEHVEMAETFYATYDLVNAFIPDASNRDKLIHHSLRICRYCGLSKPDVKFSKDAHLIPHSLGNKFLFSDFECDSCNELFGKYEDQLAKMLAPYRTLNALQVKGNKFPVFKSLKEAIRMDVRDFYENQTIQISRTEFENEDISFDGESGEMKIKYTLHPYSLQKVYKIFIKLALSMIPEAEIYSDYNLAKDFILNNLKGKLSGCIVTGYQLQFPVNFKTHLLLFKKRDLNAKTFTHVMILYTLNFIFSVPVALNKNDIRLYGNDFSTINFPLATIQKLDFEKISISSFHDDFSSDDPVKDREGELGFTINKDDLAQLKAINLETGEEVTGVEFGKEAIAKIIIGTGDLSIDLKKITS